MVSEGLGEKAQTFLHGAKKKKEQNRISISYLCVNQPAAFSISDLKVRVLTNNFQLWETSGLGNDLKYSNSLQLQEVFIYLVSPVKVLPKKLIKKEKKFQKLPSSPEMDQKTP